MAGGDLAGGEEEMICEFCGVGNPSSRFVCSQCGAPLPREAKSEPEPALEKNPDAGIYCYSIIELESGTLTRWEDMANKKILFYLGKHGPLEIGYEEIRHYEGYSWDYMRSRICKFFGLPWEVFPPESYKALA